MGSSVIRKPAGVSKSLEVHKPDDTQFVSDLLRAYETEKHLDRKAVLLFRVGQLMLQGVWWERLNMRRRKAN